MAMPPLPPGLGAQAGGAQPPGGAPMPSMMQLAGMQPDQMQMGGTPGMTPGMSQISEAAVRMGAEIDQALKLLAQSIPTLAPWVEKTCMELRYQIGTAMNSGAVPTNPTPEDGERFPDGGGRL
jgi:hypothetical protein